MIPLSFKPPSLPFLFLTNLINQSRLKPLFGLILNDLFTCWNFRFVSDPRLYEYQFLVFELIRFAFFIGNCTTIFAKPNKPYPAK